MGAYIRGEGKSDAFGGGGGLQVNEPYNWEGGGAYKWERGLRNGSLRYMENESEKRMHLFRVFFFFSGIKETVLIWILELEVVKSQITV